MTAPACRKALLDIRRDQGAHAGLLLASYLRAPVKDKDKHPAERALLLNAAVKASHDAQALYEAAYRRRQADLGQLANPASRLSTVQGRLVVGLGGENVLEAGISLHHTYGVPVIPGSALKGLAAHYCDRVWGANHQEYQRQVEEADGRVRPGAAHHVLFGGGDDAGHVVFHDAWLAPQSLKPGAGLVLDVMTPHHAGYYVGQDDAPPADFDDPTPISFLAVTGVFQVAVSCASEDGRAWAELALELVARALAHWGVGGKTRAGYGRMAASAPPAQALDDPLAAFKAWFEAQKFGGHNKGTHAAIIPELNKLKDVAAGKAFVKTVWKKKGSTTDSVWAFLNA